MAAVTQGLENAVGGIVEHQGQKPGAVDPEVEDGVGHHVLRRAHPGQDGGGEADAQDGQEDTRRQGKDHRGVDGGVHPLLVPGAVAAGDDDAGPHEDPLEKADEQVAQAPRGADGGKGVVAAEPAYHEGVRRVVELLEQVPQQKGQCKTEEDLPNDPLRHECFLFVHSLVSASIFSVLSVTRLRGACQDGGPFPDSQRGPDVV